jgi:transcriptional regulator with XRE-family HTH domain
MLTTQDHGNANSRRFQRLRRLAKAFSDRDFRHAFMGRHLRAFLAEQIRALRGDRSQKEFGELIGKPQSVVSRLEKQADKNISIQTLIDIAKKLDIAVIMRFVDFPTFLRYTEDSSDAVALPASYDENEMDKFIANVEKAYRQLSSTLITTHTLLMPSFWKDAQDIISGYPQTIVNGEGITFPEPTNYLFALARNSLAGANPLGPMVLHAQTGFIQPAPESLFNQAPTLANSSVILFQPIQQPADEGKTIDVGHDPTKRYTNQPIKH